jgi:phage terminase large subunit-like protein
VSGIPRWLAEFASLDEETLRREMRTAPGPLRRRLFEEWFWQAHRGQQEPEGDWRVWLMMAGRGFGKTRAGAEWVSRRARKVPGARIALVGATMDDVVKVMVEGESGLKAAALAGEEVRWRPSRGIVEFSSGATGYVFSGERPEKLRGPQHHFAWCDEIAKWPHGEAAWDNLMLGLRLGDSPRTVVTTTPKPVPVLKRIIAMERLARSGGGTAANVHLPEEYLSAVTSLYEGTRLGRQELEGQLIEDAEGALWSRELIEKSRQTGALTRALRRVVIGVDPPASAGGTCGIVVCGMGTDGVAYVLADYSAGGSSPAGWAARVAAASEAWGADLVVAEANNGGDMVEQVLKGADSALPVRRVNASRGKSARAEPVALRFEKGEARFAGAFPGLEDELAGLVGGGGYQGPGRSPDRADAMVWAMTELLKPRREPRILAL